jgi:hypothetical protein
MAIIHGEIDSLKNLINILNRNNISQLHTLDDVLITMLFSTPGGTAQCGIWPKIRTQFS